MSMNEKLDRAYEALIDEGRFTEDELQLVTNLVGYSMETLEDVWDVRHGHMSFSQWLGEDDEDEDEDEEENA